MYKVILRKTRKENRKLKIRERITGTAEKPRLSVFRSNKFIYAQLIDDVKGATVLTVDSLVKELHKGKNKSDASKEVGKTLAKKAIELGIKHAVFDRNGYRFHGRVKSLADGAKEGGLTL